jgi:hypothetical protein
MRAVAALLSLVLPLLPLAPSETSAALLVSRRRRGTVVRSSTTTGVGTRLAAVDPKKEIGVLPPVGYFE